jgi:hypothetical protein
MRLFIEQRHCFNDPIINNDRFTTDGSPAVTNDHKASVILKNSQYDLQTDRTHIANGINHQLIITSKNDLIRPFVKWPIAQFDEPVLNPLVDSLHLLIIGRERNKEFHGH